MEAALQTNHQETYRNLVMFYDLAEEFVNSVRTEEQEPEKQLEFVEPLIHKVVDAADTLTLEYRGYVESGKAPSVLSKKRIEKALADIEYSINTFEAYQREHHNDNL